jgi:maltooligosyltrehalose trehalohydrolase
MTDPAVLLAPPSKSIAGFGAIPVAGGVRFRVWAPPAGSLTLTIHDGKAAGDYQLPRDHEGVFDIIVDGVKAGARYAFRINEGELRPDPASRFQPEGVHGPSEVIDPTSFAWTDARWAGRPAVDRIVYELHVGTFSPEGTFAGATARLDTLRDLGISAIELMPVADFAGMRNWGYDCVCLYAPSRAYGRPDDLRRLVDRAHQLGMSVVFDVVYNHLGPEGAYLPAFNDEYFTDRHVTPWGRGVNLDGPGSAMVRRFIIDNASHWIREYHGDGLRLDATHALIEDHNGAIVREVADAARTAAPRAVFVHAEDHRNLAAMIEDKANGGWGLDGVWADDFHHVVRRLLAGDSAGYYSDYTGTVAELARTIRQGWLFTGEHSRHMGERRGTDASTVPMSRFVVCLQNHDQVGNRAFGDRLHHTVPPESWRAASALLLTLPMTPLLFMGQEWAASTPFRYFTDLNPSLGAQVTEGRRREFAHFPEFSNEQVRCSIPDPQAASTFEASRLHWDERARPEHSGVLELYRALIALRLDHPSALGASTDTAGDAVVIDDETLALRRTDGDNEVFWVVTRFRGGGEVDLAAAIDAREDGSPSWSVVLTTEDPVFAADPRPPVIDEQRGPRIRFARAGAVILRKHPRRQTV